MPTPGAPAPTGQARFFLHTGRGPDLAPHPLAPVRCLIAMRPRIHIVIALTVCLGAARASSVPAASATPVAPAEAAPAFVGSAACADCHAAQYTAWQGSHHRQAMQKADDKTVLGDFHGATFRYAGTVSAFTRRDDHYLVRTDGPDGGLHEYPVSYTFGIAPLQQYLVPFPDGRFQALPIAWDASGRRWFHLNPKERITHGDELHWTGPAMNWNYMCADCHSTSLRKNFEERTGRFDTRFSEISVGCEACHGPGSAHLAWARAAREARRDGYRQDRYSADPAHGLTARLDERKNVAWVLAPGKATATRSAPRGTVREIEVCAQCHARRGQIADGYRAGDALLDFYRPALLTSPLYHADGQQRGEVYEWGSFLQSKMYAAGVTCSDCHEPHGGKLRAAGNALCTNCHSAALFDAPAHHHHTPGSAGALCANCHMPTTVYMVVDPRRDHSLRLPRPDESVAFGTPNACNQCHAQRNAAWAAAQMKRWYGHDSRGFQRFAPAFAAAERGAVGATAGLRAVATDAAEPAIVRATAFGELDVNLNGPTLAAATAALHEQDPLIRLAALDAFTDAPPELRRREVAPLLSDRFRVIRIEAASLLADAGAGLGSPFDRAAAEFIASQRYNGDRADALTNLGSFEARRGDAAAGERELKRAVALDPNFAPAYANLADLYRSQGREAEAERVLRDGIAQAPKVGLLHHALGLSLVREKRADAALAELALAAKLDPASARFAYVYAVALDSFGHGPQALAVLIKARAAHPDDVAILEALVDFEQRRGNAGEARRYDEERRRVIAGQ